MLSKKIVDITGKYFGLLHVISLHHVKRQAYWLCKCKCGNKKVIQGVKIRNNTTVSCGCYRKKGLQTPKGAKACNWKGEKVQYRALHKRMYGLVHKPSVCALCRVSKPKQLANKSGLYKTTVDDWMWLCCTCHVRYDNGWKYINNIWYKVCNKCKADKEVNTNNFFRRKNGTWISFCKVCSIIKRRQYARKSLDK